MTTAATKPSSKDFSRLLKLIEAAVAARISLVQIREKDLTAGMVYELAIRAAAITLGSGTGLLINDRGDIAVAAGAAGVHLTTRSLNPAVIRQSFGAEFLIGVSTHSSVEARQAFADGADFVVFGPVFETASKRTSGAPVGLNSLKEVADVVSPSPVLALGGVTAANIQNCLRAGAAGIAGIRVFSEAGDLRRIVRLVHAGS